MNLSAFAEQISADLSALGRLGSEATAEAAERLSAAMDGPLTARLLEALSQLAVELESVSTGVHVEVRVAGDDAQLVVITDEPPAAAAAEAATDRDMDARITLRLPSGLKAQLESDAATEGVSLNTYIVRRLGGAQNRPTEIFGRRRMTGYGRA